MFLHSSRDEAKSGFPTHFVERQRKSKLGESGSIWLYLALFGSIWVYLGLSLAFLGPLKQIFSFDITFLLQLYKTTCIRAEINLRLLQWEPKSYFEVARRGIRIM